MTDNIGDCFLQAKINRKLEILRNGMPRGETFDPDGKLRDVGKTITQSNSILILLSAGSGHKLLQGGKRALKFMVHWNHGVYAAHPQNLFDHLVGTKQDHLAAQAFDRPSR